MPQWLLALSFAMLGWNIGLGFTRAILAHARRALMPTIGLHPRADCLFRLSRSVARQGRRHRSADRLSSRPVPAGLDSIAVIAASSDVDLPFVMALQTARLLIITLIGPALARFVADRA